MTESIVARYDRLLEEASSVPLSQLLPSMLTLARKLGNQKLEKWVRLELDGYFNSNSALTEDVVVPEYRTIGGYRSDEFGRPLLLRDSRLQFINQDRLRMGVAELERLAVSQGPLTYREPVASEVIRDTLGVEVTRFTFHPSGVSDVLSGVRTRVIDWLYEIEPEINKFRKTSTQQSDPQIESSQLTKRHIIIISSLGLFLVTMAVFLISSFVQPILPPSINRVGILIITAFIGVVAVLAGLNEVIELFHKLFGAKTNK